MHRAWLGDAPGVGALARLTTARALALLAATALVGLLPIVLRAPIVAHLAHGVVGGLLAAAANERRRTTSGTVRAGWCAITLVGATIGVLRGALVVAALLTQGRVGLGEAVPAVYAAASVAVAVLAAAGMVPLLPRPASRSGWWRAAFDSGALGGCIVIVVWEEAIEPWAESSGDVSSPALVASITAPLLFATLAAYAAIAAYRHPASRRRLGALAVGACAEAGATAFGMLVVTSDAPASHGLVATLHHVGVTALVAAAVLGEDRRRPDRRRSGLDDVIVPYLALVALLPIVAVEAGRGLDPVFAVMTSVVAAFVLVRQLLTLVENAALHRDLEQRVALRTLELERREARHRALVENLTEGLAVLDRNGVFRWASPATERYAGYEPGSLAGVFSLDLIHPADAPRAGDFFADLATTTEERRINLRIRDATGGWREVETVGRNLLDEPSVWGIVLTMSDQTALQRLRRELADRAIYDPLTGLVNGSQLLERLADRLARGADGSTALILVDLDHFRELIDAHGRPAGDAVVVEAAARIVAAVTEERTTIGRFESDEFGIVPEWDVDPDTADDIAGRVLEALREPFTSVGVPVTASVGLVQAEAGCSADELLRRASLAVAGARTGGRDRVERYSPAMHVELVGRLQLHDDLTRAVSDGQLRVYYQPIVRMSDERIVGAEALVRWQHPTDGLRAPGDFIEVAEQTGLIVPIGAWVLEEATRELARWSVDLDRNEPMMLSVNVSAVQLRHPGLVDVVARAIAAAGIDPSRVLIEITESVVVAPELVAVVADLRALGVGIAIDDFGTGYSSLSYLRDFPLDAVKIDRSFVRDAGRGSAQAVAIVSGVTDLAEQLGLRVVAEGVEGAAELAAVRRARCGYVQGFHFAKPLPPAVFAARIDDQAAAGSLRARLGGLTVAGASARKPPARQT